MPSLLDMTDIPMRLILAKSNFRSIQNLRKSCRDLRHFIDDVKPESDVSQIYIQQDLYQINLALDIDQRNYDIIYQKWDNGCKVKRNRVSEKVLKHSDFVEIACKDIESILESQKSGILEKFEVFLCDRPEKQNGIPNIVATQLTENLQKILKAQNLKVKKFKITFGCPEKIMSFLPFLEPGTLEHIILKARRENSKCDLSGIWELEQWKNAKKLVFGNILVPDDFPVSSFVQFQEAFLEIERVTLDMVVDMKEAFLTHKHMEYFEIKYDRYDVSGNQLEEQFGPGYRKSKWFFRIPEDSEKFLLMSFSSMDLLCFKRIEKKGIPGDAMIY